MGHAWNCRAVSSCTAEGAKRSDSSRTAEAASVRVRTRSRSLSTLPSTRLSRESFSSCLALPLCQTCIVLMVKPLGSVSCKVRSSSPLNAVWLHCPAIYSLVSPCQPCLLPFIVSGRHCVGSVKFGKVFHLYTHSPYAFATLINVFTCC